MFGTSLRATASAIPHRRDLDVMSVQPASTYICATDVIVFTNKTRIRCG